MSLQKQMSKKLNNHNFLSMNENSYIQVLLYEDRILSGKTETFLLNSVIDCISSV